VLAWSCAYLVGCAALAGCASGVPQPQVLAATTHPVRLAEPITLAVLDGGLAACPPPAPGGLCNVVGPILVITKVRSLRLLQDGRGYAEFSIRVPTAEQPAVDSFFRRANNHQIGIELGTAPYSTELVAGIPPPPRAVVFLVFPAPTTNRAAERMFRSLTSKN
jgi:hypothetical protein